MSACNVRNCNKCTLQLEQEKVKAGDDAMRTKLFEKCFYKRAFFFFLIRAARKKQAKGRVPQSGEVEKVVL